MRYVSLFLLLALIGCGQSRAIRYQEIKTYSSGKLINTYIAKGKISHSFNGFIFTDACTGRETYVKGFQYTIAKVVEYDCGNP